MMPHLADFSIPTNSRPLVSSLRFPISRLDFVMEAAGLLMLGSKNQWNTDCSPDEPKSLDSLASIICKQNFRLSVLLIFILVKCRKQITPAQRDFSSFRQYREADGVRSLSLEPEEYCAKWVPVYQGKKPGERGYRAACIRELAKISGVKESTIDINWGANFEKRPQYLPRMLKLADIINQLKQILPLPVDWPLE